MTQAPADLAKRAAAQAALDLVTEGMRLGLGSGSTAAWFVRLLGERVAQGLNVTCVATSSGTARLAAEAGVPLVRLAEAAPLDLTVDGADEIDAELRLIKGGGAALLQEKIVASASKRLVIVADAGKRVATLGAFPLPVEVVRFGWPVTQAAIERALAEASVDDRSVAVRVQDGEPLLTDEGHYILDLRLGRIGDPEALALALSAIPGVVEHGLFIDLAESAIIGHADGHVEHLTPTPSIADEHYVEEVIRSLDA
jgi:ribose 5-phosphate isomerase A